jgi:mRNA interferase RelE/StbE
VAYSIEITRSAERELRRLPREVQQRIAAAVECLREDPRRARAGCEVRPLSSTTNAWRLRAGEYRVIYAVEERTVVITRIGHRTRVYRR